MNSIVSVLFSTILFSGVSAVAQFIPSEVDLCRNGRCTQAMMGVQNQFDSGVEFNPLTGATASFYSGNCYHQMQYMNPEHEHHGGFVFWRDENDVLNFNGLFSYFAQTNPYAGMTTDEGFKRIRSRTRQPYAVREETTQGHVIMEGETHRIDYWMRTNTDGSEMYILSRSIIDAIQSRSFCSLKRH